MFYQEGKPPPSENDGDGSRKSREKPQSDLAEELLQLPKS